MLPPNLKPFLQLIFITLLLRQLNQVNSTTLLDFSFPNFFLYPYKNGTKLTFLGNATLATGALQLTKTDDNGIPTRLDTGQVSYSDLVFLWDRSGHRASFHTSFSFFLKNRNDPRKKTADGFAFFLAAKNSTIEDYGGCLGLFQKQNAKDPKKNQVVAIEFDTWQNKEYYDPAGPHIGIDVNSTISVNTTRWQEDDAYSTKTGTVHITYDAKSKNLSVRLTYVNGREYNLSKVVDLAEALPKWVRIGFSGATGERDAATPYILSWNFTSTLVSKRISAMNENLSSMASY